MWNPNVKLSKYDFVLPSYSVYLRLVLIVLSNLLLFLGSELFPSDLPTQLLYEFVLDMHTTCSAYFNFLNLITPNNVR
jgi:hypothetical protein